MLTLRFLATGDSYHSLSYTFRLGVSTISMIVTEVTKALAEKLAPLIKIASNADEWREIADGFEQKWQFPHTCGNKSMALIKYCNKIPHFIGAIDGKHITIRKPKKSGSLYYNYKGYFSIVLLAICDANLRIIYAHYGSFGSQGDAGIFGRSDFCALLNSGGNLFKPKIYCRTFRWS